MHRTKEIRWFFGPQNKTIKKWFDSLDFDPLEVTTDRYLKVDTTSVGIKTRDDSIDVKQRIGNRAKGCLNMNLWGYYEEFVKWSFEANSQDALFNRVMADDYNDWLSITKNRSIAQLTRESGEIVVKPKSSHVAIGCQVEYSRLEINGQQHHTFGLEWFGEQLLTLDKSIIVEILGDTKLHMGKSHSYPSFLQQFFKTEKRKLHTVCKLIAN